jgi:hypothetical protein
MSSGPYTLSRVNDALSRFVNTCNMVARRLNFLDQWYWTQASELSERGKAHAEIALGTCMNAERLNSQIQWRS